MCGIFGFIIREPVFMTQVFQALYKLENSIHPGLDQKVGGYGAGVAVLLGDGDVISEKVGQTTNSPVLNLEKSWNNGVEKASVLLGHVRYPSQEFMNTAKFKEAAQPFVEHFDPKLTIVSSHNGHIDNYAELKSHLKNHVFDTYKIGLVDSEIVPHYFGELLNETTDSDEAAMTLLSNLKGSSTAAILQVDEENAILQIIHKGRTNGVTVWANEKSEVIFSSRPEPVLSVFDSILVKRNFKIKASINWHENALLKLSFSAAFQ
jgi:glucosamine 6-phosphate synthetase-like amidotransferase/phosphosugar isomerase protein